MRKIGLLKCVFSSLLFAYVFYVFGLAMGEELLSKEGLKYLGWVIEKDKFKTCDKTLMEIGNGKIDPTNDKCPKNGPLKFRGRVIRVEQVDDNTVFEMTDQKGHTYKLFFYKDAGKLMGLKRGVEVTVTVPVLWRASAIEFIDEGKKTPSDLIPFKKK
jgi:hypothetical protein